MHWNFVGSTVSWSGIKGLGANICLDTKWHMPLPDMGGPVPEFELNELETLFGKELRVRFTSGGSESAIQYVEDTCKFYGLENTQTTAVDRMKINGTITLLNDGAGAANLTYYLQDDILAGFINSVEAYAAAQCPKCYSGNVSCFLLVGDRALHTKSAWKAEFLSGERTVLVSGLPAIQFVQGEEALAQPDFQSLLTELREQF